MPKALSDTAVPTYLGLGLSVTNAVAIASPVTVEQPGVQCLAQCHLDTGQEDVGTEAPNM